jgi:hypothetical protein
MSGIHISYLHENKAEDRSGSRFNQSKRSRVRFCSLGFIKSDLFRHYITILLILKYHLVEGYSSNIIRLSRPTVSNSGRLNVCWLISRCHRLWYSGCIHRFLIPIVGVTVDVLNVGGGRARAGLQRTMRWLHDYLCFSLGSSNDRADIRYESASPTLEAGWL